MHVFVYIYQCQILIQTQKTIVNSLISNSLDHAFRIAPKDVEHKRPVLGSGHLPDTSLFFSHLQNSKALP